MFRINVFAKFINLDITVNNADIKVRLNSFLENFALSMKSEISYLLGSDYQIKQLGGFGIFIIIGVTLQTQTL